MVRRMTLVVLTSLAAAPGFGQFRQYHVDGVMDIGRPAYWTPDKKEAAMVQLRWLWEHQSQEGTDRPFDPSKARFYSMKTATFDLQGRLTKVGTNLTMSNGAVRDENPWDRVSVETVLQNVRACLEFLGMDASGARLEVVPWNDPTCPEGKTRCRWEDMRVYRASNGAECAEPLSGVFDTVTGKVLRLDLIGPATLPQLPIQWRTDDFYAQMAANAYQRFNPMPSAWISEIKHCIALPMGRLYWTPGAEYPRPFIGSELDADDIQCLQTRQGKYMVRVTFLATGFQPGDVTLQFEDVYLDGRTGRPIQIYDEAHSGASLVAPPSKRTAISFEARKAVAISGWKGRLTASRNQGELTGREVLLQQGRTLYAAKLSKDGKTMTIGEGKTAQTFLVPKELLGKDLVGKPFGKKE